MPRVAPAPFIGVGTVAAIALAKIPAIVAAFGAGWAAVSLAGLDLVLATVGMAWAEPRGTRPLELLLAVQFALAAVVLVLTRGESFLITMPLVSMAVLFLSPRAALAVGGGVLASFAAIAFAEYPPEVALRGLVGLVSAIGFVWVFSRLMVRERAARTEVERLLGDLSEAHARLAAQMTEIEQLAAAGERNRIAREIHDGLGHTLSVASIQLEAARAEAAESDAQRERIARAQEVLREGLGELRRSVSMLRDGDPRGRAFPEAIARLVSESETPSQRILFAIEGTPRLVPATLGFTLYRAAQEAITNARKHARASLIEVFLTYGPREVHLLVRDDGPGEEPIVPGNGLLGLKERVAQVGGALEVTRASAGVALSVTVPLPEAQA